MHLETWAEFRYWHLHRPKERLLGRLAARLPRRFKERVYIAVAVEALAAMPSSTIVPEVGMLEALEAFGRA